MPGPGVHPTLAEALTARGYEALTPVQTAVLAEGSGGRDLLVSAKTGSGKTVAYGLAFAESVFAGEDGFGRPGDPRVLVIAPTRELAQQVQGELAWLYAGATVAACVGGMDPRAEARRLAAGAHIVVGTPGRLRDHLERGQLVTSSLRAVVLDEADEMLDLGFREELEEILDTAPAERRTLLFSATLPKPITAMATRYQRDALRIEVGGEESGHGDIDYRAVRVAPSDVEHGVVNLLRFFEAGAALVFCSTREAVKRLHANLVERGFSVVALSGELTQSERSHALQALRDRRARVCVATDVAARGIDIPDLELVIHAELPNDADTLQHRSGRTGRAGRKGVCAVLVPHPRRRKAEQLFRAAKIDIDWTTPPTLEEIRARDAERMLTAIPEPAEEELEAARALLEDRGADAVAAALIRLMRERLPSPEELVDAGPEPTAPAARAGFEGSVWFRMDQGRNRNADPRWLLPLICRLGHVTKGEIGAIRVFDRETRFEITGAAAQRFTEAVAKAEDADVHIVKLDEAGPLPPRERRPQSPRSKAPVARATEGPRDVTPWRPDADAPSTKRFKPKGPPGPKRSGKRPGNDARR